MGGRLARADSIPYLGGAGDYAVLGLDGAKITISGSSTYITGAVGLGTHGVQYFSKGTIDGTFFVDPTANNSRSNSVVITGGTVIQDLSSAEAAALASSAQASALTATQSFGNVYDPLTITGNGGLNVISMLSLSLGTKEVLTIKGTPDDVFVFNVAGMVHLSSSSSSIVVSGVPESHVLFNLTATGTPLQTSGASLFGTYLAPNGTISLSAGQVVGELIAGRGVSIVSGAAVHVSPFLQAAPPPSGDPNTPEPATGASLGLLLGGLAVVQRRRQAA